MSDDLMSIEEMAEIPKDVASAQGKRGCSKGVNLFLARQKLIADMMEEEETDSSVSGSAVRINEGVVPSTSKEPSVHSQSAKPQSYVMISAADKKKKSAEAISEIPDPSISESGSSKSKGVNLFLARQKLIADMMAAEEEEEKAAEEAKKREAEEKLKQEELKRKQEEERIKLEELQRIEREKLVESEKKKAARAAKFKTNKIPAASEPEPDLSWVKKKTTKPSTSAEPRKTLYQLLSNDKK
ncbi:uncharacterized protein YscB-like [Watersipora subatra]|uniref:uncharacterized protein YscB-like n=1 Tax=Watersipora subatra TaxID=2589382 RepID=UPI00355B6728